MYRGETMTFKLTSQKILETEFKIDFNGYNAQEVDSFLDKVIEDYHAFENLITEQKALLERYETTLENQKRMIREYQSNNRAQKEVEPQPSYVDLLKRISKLEAQVFKE